MGRKTISVFKEFNIVEPDIVFIFESGVFYNVYGENAYILSYLLGYKMKEREGVKYSGFPEKALNKVISTLEKEKISYAIYDPSMQYEKVADLNFKNNNKYNKILELSRPLILQQDRINNIFDNLQAKITIYRSKNIEKLDDILNKLEKILGINNG